MQLCTLLSPILTQAWVLFSWCRSCSFQNLCHYQPLPSGLEGVGETGRISQGNPSVLEWSGGWVWEHWETSSAVFLRSDQVKTTVVSASPTLSTFHIPGNLGCSNRKQVWRILKIRIYFLLLILSFVLTIPTYSPDFPFSWPLPGYAPHPGLSFVHTWILSCVPILVVVVWELFLMQIWSVLCLMLAVAPYCPQDKIQTP